MLNEQVRHPDLDARHVLLDGLVHLGGDEVATPRGGGDADLVLEPLGEGHGGGGAVDFVVVAAAKRRRRRGRRGDSGRLGADGRYECERRGGGGDEHE